MLWDLPMTRASSPSWRWHTIDALRGKCLDQTRLLSATRSTASTQHSSPRDNGSP